MLGKIEGKRRREQPRIRWINSITNSMGMTWSKFREIEEDRGDWYTTITLPTKVHIVRAIVFPVVMYRCENWNIRKAKR